MSTTVESATEIRPFHVDIPESRSSTTCAGASRRRAGPPRSWSQIARRACSWDAAGARALLGDRLRLAQGRGEAQRAAAVHDRDRRRRHPLHPRELAARERVAADHDPRLARLGHRAARDRRPAHRSDRARRTRRGRLRPRAAVHSRLRLLRRADRPRLGPGPRRARMGGADASARLHPLRRPGRRRRCLHHRRDGPPGTRGAGRHPYQLAGDWSGRRRPPVRHRGGKSSARRARHIHGERLRLLPRTGHAATDDRLRAARFTRRPGGLDARPRHGQLPQDLPRLCRRRACGQSHARPHPRQHHAVLADGHRGLGGPVVLGERTSPSSCGGPSSTAGLTSRLASRRSPTRSSRPRAVGSSRRTPTSTYYNKAERGGHFAAWEEPELFSNELRAAFGSLR